MKKTSIFLLFFVVFTAKGQKSIDKLYQFSQSYGVLRHFYPEPMLKAFDWSAYLDYINYNTINDTAFDYKKAIKEIVPLAQFSLTEISNEDSLYKESLDSMYYWQYVNAVSTEEYSQSNAIVQNDIIHSEMRYTLNPLVFNKINFNRFVGCQLKVKFKAKLVAEQPDSAWVLLHSFDARIYLPNEREKAIRKNYANRIKIYNQAEWKDYEVEIPFCSDCPISAMTYLKIVRPLHRGTLYIDDIEVSDVESGEIIASEDFEKTEDEIYKRFRLKLLKEKTIEHYFDETLQSKCLKLKGKRKYTFYEQKNLAKKIVSKIDSSLYFAIPRFLNIESASQDSIVAPTIAKQYDTVRYEFLRDFIHLNAVIQQNSLQKENIDNKTLFYECVTRLFSAEQYTIQDHILNLVHFMAPYQDPHLALYVHGSTDVNMQYLPIEINKVKDEYVIIRSLEPELERCIGKKVKNINNIPVKQWVEQQFSIPNSSSISNYAINTYLQYGFNFRYQKNQDPVQIQLKNGKNIRVNYADLGVQYRLPLLPKDTAFSFLNDKVAFFSYLSMGSTFRCTLAFLDSLKNKDYIIIDYRGFKSGSYKIDLMLQKGLNNGVDFSANNKISYISEPFYQNVEYVPFNVIEPNLKKINKTNDDKKLYILIDKNVKSIKEITILPLYENNLATFIGQATAGTIGNVIKEKLPSSKVKVFFTAGYGTYANGEKYQGKPMQPHYYTKPRIHKNITLKNDKAFLKAKQLVKKAIRKDERRNLKK